MEIKTFDLKNFRNYEQQKILFEPGISVLCGSNGQGKTNILEGINFLLSGKSYRVKQEVELIRWGQKNFYIQGTCQVSDRVIQLESYYEVGKKVMKINHMACKRLSDYVGTVNAVFFSPDDLNIVKKSPLERRRFLDLLISQIVPGHIYLLNSYLKVIKQKNNLLRTEKRTPLLKSQLEAWNEQLLDIGSRIIVNRSKFCEKLNHSCQRIFQQIFSPGYQLNLHYCALGKKDSAEALQSFAEILESKLDMEIERKAVLVGPHKDDLLIELNGKAAKLFASQGQQRLIVLCLKLGEMEIILNEKGEYPILLLDDVLSELDELRRKYLIEFIAGSHIQTIITMTEADSQLNHIKKAVYQVSNGSVRRQL